MELFRHKTLRFYSIAVCFLSFLLVFWNSYRLFSSPLVPSHTQSAIIQVHRSTSAHEFVQNLKTNNYISSSSLLLLIIRLEGLTHQLKAGVYQIKPGETAHQLLHRVVAGDVLRHNFTIIAGTRSLKIEQDMIQSPHLEYHPEDWNAIKKDHPNADGLLLAETYQYRAGNTSRSILEQANQDLINFLNSTWHSRAPNLPYKKPYDLLIAASIIEKESASPEERKLISGVLINRLNKGMPLQMDPTVIYALDNAYKGKLSHNDLMVDSPYNSYRYRGLPPTPIAMVGKESILAAAQPQSSNYLYFVAKGDGSHQFSETYIQQRQAISQYQHKGA
ncbi:MAG: endolytic transglycosylase MltG [Legionella sp.]|nr:endolytic transglycosylase MltG [Legionella sp.]